MKYKNRKDVKRKYKQALLATVATMTLGVSTFAAKEDNISVISSLIGLLWSEEGLISAQIMEMRKQILTLMDQKFDIEYVNNLKTAFKRLNSNILTLEKSLNSNTNAVYYD
ncbi:hypothetical protein GH866_28385 [Bacillus thuringiensis]|nr:hypothetical protein [Bacillus thuringiensis]